MDELELLLELLLEGLLELELEELSGDWLCVCAWRLCFPEFLLRLIEEWLCPEVLDEDCDCEGDAAGAVDWF